MSDNNDTLDMLTSGNSAARNATTRQDATAISSEKPATAPGVKRKRSAAYSICGRAGRMEFLAYLGVALAAHGLNALLGSVPDSAALLTLVIALRITAVLFLLAAIIRRLHDWGWSGFALLCLLPLIPALGVNIIVAIIFLIALSVVPGEPRTNCFGDDILGRQKPAAPKHSFRALHFYGILAKINACVVLILGLIATLFAFFYEERSYWSEPSNPYRTDALTIFIATVLLAASYFVSGSFAFSQVALAKKISKLRSSSYMVEEQRFWLLVGGWYFRVIAILIAVTGVYMPAIYHLKDANAIDANAMNAMSMALITFPLFFLVAWLCEGIAEILFCQSWCEANCPLHKSNTIESSVIGGSPCGNRVYGEHESIQGKR